LESSSSERPHFCEASPGWEQGGNARPQQQPRSSEWPQGPPVPSSARSQHHLPSARARSWRPARPPAAPPAAPAASAGRRSPSARSRSALATRPLRTERDPEALGAVPGSGTAAPAWHGRQRRARRAQLCAGHPGLPRLTPHTYPRLRQSVRAHPTPPHPSRVLAASSPLQNVLQTLSELLGVPGSASITLRQQPRLHPRPRARARAVCDRAVAASSHQTGDSE